MATLTGKSRTITISGDITYDASPTSPAREMNGSVGVLKAQTTGASFSLFSLSSGSGLAFRVDSVSGPFPGSPISSVGSAAAGLIHVTWSVTLKLREYWSSPPSGFSVSPTLFEALFPGDPISISCGGASYSGPSTNTSPFFIPQDSTSFTGGYLVDQGTSIRLYDSLDTGHVSVTAIYNGDAFEDAVTYSHTTGTRVTNIDFSGGVSHTESTGASGMGAPTNAELICGFKEYNDVDVYLVYPDGTPFDQDIRVLLNRSDASTANTIHTGTSGHANFSNIRKNFVAQYFNLGGGPTTIIDTDTTASGFNISLNSSDLTAAGITVTDTEPIIGNTALKVPFKFTPFNFFTLGHSPTSIIDNCTSATGWSNMSVTGSGLSLTRATSSGVASKTYNPRIYAESYRFVEINLAGHGFSGGTGTVEFIDAASSPIVRQYPITTGADGVFNKVVIDLCSPATRTNTEINDTRFPLTTENGDADTPLTQATMWGLNRVKTLKFTFGGASGTVEVNYVKFIRQNSAILHCLNEHDYSFVNSPSKYTRNLTSNTDGRRSLEYIGSNSGGDTAFPFFSVVDINKRLGWTASFNTSQNGTFYFTSSASNVGGGGCIIDKNGLITSYLNVNVNSSVTVPSQLGTYNILVYPGCGKNTMSDDYAKINHHYALKVLGGLYEGIILNPSGLPSMGVDVKATLHSGSVGPPAVVSDSLGRYATKGKPWINGPAGYDLVATGATTTHTASNVLTGINYINRVCFGNEDGGAIGTDLDCIHDEAMGLYYASYTRNSDIFVLRNDFTIPIAGSSHEVRVTNSGNCAHPALGKGQGLVVYLTYQKSSDIVYVSSIDQSKTWSDELTLFTGLNPKYPRLATMPDGTIVWAAFKYVSGSSGPGNIYTIKLDPGTDPSSFPSPIAIKDQTGTLIQVKDQVFDFSYSNDRHGRFLLFCNVDGNTEPSHFASTDFATTFTLIYP